MKRDPIKTIQFIALLLLAFATMASADDQSGSGVGELPTDENSCPSNFRNNAGECYIIMPKASESDRIQSYNIPQNLKQFKFYDNGGKGNYEVDENADGKFARIAFKVPKGYHLRISGKINIWGTFIISYTDKKGESHQILKSCEESRCNENIDYEMEIKTQGSYLIPFSDGMISSGYATGWDLTVTLVQDVAEEVSLSTDDGVYIKMPHENDLSLMIPDDVTSFSVYDEGGKNGDYQNSSHGNLILTAPEGKRLLLTGNMIAEGKSERDGGEGLEQLFGINGDYLIVYDGDLNAEKLLETSKLGLSSGKLFNIGAVVSSGRTLSLHFYSNGSDAFAGLDLKVNVIEADVDVIEPDVILTATTGKKKLGVINGTYIGETSVNIASETAIDTVMFLRDFSTSGYSTLMLPFDYVATNLENVESVIEFEKMTSNDKGELAVGMSYVWCSKEFEDALAADAAAKGKAGDYEQCNSDGTKYPGNMKAYTPYMVQMTGSQLVFKEGTLLKTLSDAPEVSKNGWTFKGVLQKKVFTKEETQDGRIWGYAGENRNGATIGQFVRFGKGAYVQPFRAYMVSGKPQLVSASPNAQFTATPTAGVETASLPDNIDVVIVSRDNDGEKHTTTVGKLNTRTGEFEMIRDYDLKGRKTNLTNRAQGAYYGKKVLKK